MWDAARDLALENPTIPSDVLARVMDERARRRPSGRCSQSSTTRSAHSVQPHKLLQTMQFQEVIRVNLLGPFLAIKHGSLEIAKQGLIDTGMTRPLFEAARLHGFEDKIGQFTPLQRADQSKEIAAAALFLISDESSYVDGHALVVDGGLTASVPHVVFPLK